MSQHRKNPDPRPISRLALRLSNERDDLLDTLLMAALILGVDERAFERAQVRDDLDNLLVAAIHRFRAGVRREAMRPSAAIRCSISTSGPMVQLQVLSMPDSLRGRGEIARLGHLRLVSTNRPFLSVNAVFLRGTRRDCDGDVVRMHLGSEEKAIAFADHLGALVARANESLAAQGVRP